MPAEATGRIYTWNGYAETAAVRSLLRHVDTHGERLRSIYLAFVHDLGAADVGGRTVLEHLDTGGFSFWWTTLLAERSIFKSPRIVDCLRLLALGDILDREPSPALTLWTGDRVLAAAVGELCAARGMTFAWRRCEPASRPRLARRVHDALPHVCQGLFQLVRHAVSRWPLRRGGAPRWHGGDRAITLVSYFFALDSTAAARGEFYQKQWEALPGLLDRAGVRANWLHHFLYGPDAPDTRRAVDLIRRFNAGGAPSAHALVDSALTVPLLLRVVRRWCALLAAAVRLRAIRTRFTPAGTRVPLWALLRDDWYSSILGTAAIVHLTLFALFERLLAALPPQPLGLYLCENQGWERTLIAAWRKHGHGCLVGVQHSTVRFWDLRYTDDPRTVRSASALGMPLPDRVAVNGPVAWNAFAGSGYATERLAAVEALRYQHLCTAAPRPAPDGPRRRVLILGDFRASSTSRMLECVDAAFRSDPHPPGFVLRCHPAGRVDPATVTPLVERSERPLPDLIAECDAVFCSNTTSAGLDAYLAGLPVIVYLNDDSLNVSPLRGVPGVPFVSDGPQFAAALAGAGAGAASAASQFFWLDPQLSRWRGLLSGAGVSVG